MQAIETYTPETSFKISQRAWETFGQWEKNYVMYCHDKAIWGDLTDIKVSLTAYKRFKVEHPKAILVGACVANDGILYQYSRDLRRLKVISRDSQIVNNFLETRPIFKL